MKKILFLLISFILLLSLSACGASFEHIELDDVESIKIWLYEDDGTYNYRNLTQGEIMTFIELYNTSTYVGKATGEGCTPQFGASIELKKDRTLLVNEFCGQKADIEAGKYYINNQELLKFIQDQV